jgi:hypothetical protein
VSTGIPPLSACSWIFSFFTSSLFYVIHICNFTVYRNGTGSKAANDLFAHDFSKGIYMRQHYLLVIFTNMTTRGLLQSLSHYSTPIALENLIRWLSSADSVFLRKNTLSGEEFMEIR